MLAGRGLVDLACGLPASGDAHPCRRRLLVLLQWGTEMSSYIDRKRAEGMEYFRLKNHLAHEIEVDTLRRTLYEVLNDIYGPEPRFKRIEK